MGSGSTLLPSSRTRLIMGGFYRGSRLEGFTRSCQRVLHRAQLSRDDLGLSSRWRWQQPLRLMSTCRHYPVSLKCTLPCPCHYIYSFSVCVCTCTTIVYALCMPCLIYFILRLMSTCRHYPVSLKCTLPCPCHYIYCLCLYLHHHCVCLASYTSYHIASYYTTL